MKTADAEIDMTKNKNRLYRLRNCGELNKIELQFLEKMFRRFPEDFAVVAKSLLSIGQGDLPDPLIRREYCSKDIPAGLIASPSLGRKRRKTVNAGE